MTAGRSPRGARVLGSLRGGGVVLVWCVCVQLLHSLNIYHSNCFTYEPT